MDDTWRRRMHDSYGMDGPPDEEPDATRWRRMSPALNVAAVHAALLMQLADEETFMTWQWYGELRDLHKPVEMIVYPNEHHNKVEPIHRLEVYDRNVDWFNFWLQGKEDGNPLKQAQYVRWGKLLREYRAAGGHSCYLD